MKKLDLIKEFKTEYSAKPTPVLMNIAPSSYLSVSGKGDPSSEAFQKYIQALYALAYAVKFHCKSREQDFVVSKLEGLWWFDEKQYQGITISNAPTMIPRAEWEFRLLIRMPDFVKAEDLSSLRPNLAAKKAMPLINEVTLYEMHEGLVVQALHTGPFDTEPETLARIGEFMSTNHLVRNGLHHEIYLSDFRKTPQDRLKTILREPVKSISVSLSTS